MNERQESATGVRTTFQAGAPRSLGSKLEGAKNPRRALQRGLAYIAPEARRLAWVVVFVIGYTVLGLLGPYWMGRGIDRHLMQRDGAGLARIALLMLGAFGCAALLQLVSNAWMVRISQAAIARLRQDLFTKLQTLPISFFDRNPAGELMSRLTNDLDAIQQAIAQNLILLFASVLSLVGILVAMFALDGRLALGALLVVPLMVIVTRFVARTTRRGFRELQQSLGGLNALLEETLSGQRVIRALRRQDAMRSTFQARNTEVFTTGVSANTYALLLMPLTTVLGNLFVIVIAALGGLLALRGLVSVGVIASFVNYGQNFVQPLRQLSNLYNTLQAGLAGAERAFQILDLPSETDAPAERLGPAPKLRGDVRFENVTFGYSPDHPVLHEISLSVRAGAKIAVVGPTGAGKTTLMNILTRFYEVDSGAVYIDGQDLRSIPKATLRLGLGLVLQDTFLFSASVLENIRYGRLNATDEEVIRAAQLADADYFIRQLPEGYRTQLSERAQNISHGQRQLLSIARTLLADPAILILDEATSSVDSRTEARLQRSLRSLLHGRTSFVIAHRLSTIRDADQVLVVDSGRIVQRGSHEELLRQDGPYRGLYLSQFVGKR
ncbi:MAG TPA: ABC transporter ATP-binding protein [Polyangiaceae bacterium]|nr:ABC transporter ATP-binding protein [Polyangiaceae bacterium]